MGATFSDPTYLYEAGTKPDLVDPNGPLYTRTKSVVRKVTPTSMKVFVQPVSMVGSNPMGSSPQEVQLNVHSHDLSLILDPAAPVPGTENEPVFSYRIVGSLVLAANSTTYLTLGDTATLFSAQLSFEPFTVLEGIVRTTMSSCAITSVPPYGDVLVGATADLFGAFTSSDPNSIQQLLGSLSLSGVAPEQRVSSSMFAGNYTLS